LLQILKYLRPGEMFSSRRWSLRVLCGQKGFNTEVTETLCVLGVKT